MANTNSDLVANRFATPIVHTVVGQIGGRMRIAGGNFEVAAADIDADGDTLRLAILPAHARVWGIFIGGDDVDTSTDLSWNIGLYEPGTDDTAPGTLVVTAAADGETLFASAITQQAVLDLGLVNLVVEAYATASVNWLKFGHELWDLAEDTEGAFDTYEIVATQTTAAASAAAGTIAFMIFWTLD